MDYLYNPYPSTRHTVFAKNGMVATSQPLAAQAGIEIMRKGRQRNRCGNRNSRRTYRRRTNIKRHRRRRIRTRLGQQQTARPQRIRPSTAISHNRRRKSTRPRQNASPRPNANHSPRRTRSMGRTRTQIRKTTIKRITRTSHPLRRRRLPAHTDSR